jgi:hypothetical protein
MEPHTIRAEDAHLISEWIRTRQGIAIWRSINLSNPGASWTTPVLDESGKRVTKPTWESANEPERIITDVADVLVSVDKEVKRFHIGVRMGGQGFSLKVTDGGTRRIRRAVAKAGEGAYYQFDYMTQEAVILAPEKTMSLAQWEAQQ